MKKAQEKGRRYERRSGHEMKTAEGRVINVGREQGRNSIQKDAGRNKSNSSLEG